MPPILFLAALLATAAASPDPNAAPARSVATTPRSSAVMWAELTPYVQSAMAVRRESQERWALTVLPPVPGPGAGNPLLASVAMEALTAALPDVSWLAGEIFSSRMVVSASVRKGDVIRPTANYLEAFMKVPSFTDPVRRFADASLRSKGLACGDCLSAIRPARDVTWIEIRGYIERFIYVKSIEPAGEDDRVDLYIAGEENALPDLGLANHDIAGAVHAAMNAALRSRPEFGKAIQRLLNEELLALGEDRSQVARAQLNRALPRRVLADPEAMGAVLAHLGESLERHSLHCLNCPGPTTKP